MIEKMFFLPWIKKQSVDEVVAIIHIGSSMVSGGLVMLHAGAERHTCATILMAETFNLEINPERLSLRYYLPNLFSSLDQLVDKIFAAEKKFGRPRRVYFFLPSLLVSTQNRLTRLADKDKVRVSETVIEELALAEADELLAEQPTLYPELAGDKTIILESEILKAEADGYVLNPGASGWARELTITTRLVLTSREIVKQLKERARKLKPLEQKIYLKTFISSAANVLADIGGRSNFLILDPVGILTDFAVVKNNIIVTEGSFPLGQSTLVGNLTKKLDTTASEVLSTLKLAGTGDLSTHAAKIFNKAASDFRRDWLTSLKTILDTSLQDKFLPETIFVNGGGEADKFFIDWLADDGLNNLTISHHQPTVFAITPSLWSSWCLAPQAVRALPALSIEGVFCDKIRLGV